MSKVRVYDLARELGVENKVILEKAKLVGVAGLSKLSHSSSIDGDEADAIRRAVLRPQGGSSNEPKETVTKRVDRSTGVAEAVVERRAGNVIRRRKQEVVEPVASVDVAATESADQIFNATPSVEESELPAVEEAEQTEIQEPIAEDAPVEEVVEAAAEPARPIAVEAKPGTPRVSYSQQITPAVLPRIVQPKAGPRILGKIELPTRPVPKTTLAAKSPTQFGAAKTKTGKTQAEDEEEARLKKKNAGKTGRKREFSSSDLVDYDSNDVRRVRPGQKGGRSKGGSDNQQNLQPIKRSVKIGNAITVGELAKQLTVKSAEVVAKLFELGVMATINHSIDYDTAHLIAEEFDATIEKTAYDEVQVLKDLIVENEANKVARPPVVTIMGHVDHGKTSLLDYIRKAAIAAKEHGGITQHIGAYQFDMPDNKSITFLDTPGHAAFTQMRARGAKVTDIVVLVVAADDGVMPQTIEAINHAKAAEVPIVVAVNKIDKPQANFDRIRQQLAEHGLQPEDWGGQTMFFKVSALKGTGVKEFLEGLLLIAEVEDLRADPTCPAGGTVLEARQDKGLGNVATILVQRGTLRIGDLFVSGQFYGRIRTMTSDKGARLKEAGPSTPVAITGMSGLPLAGDDFIVVDTEARAKDIALEREQRISRDEQSLSTGPISLEEFSRRANNLAALELNLIIKADVQGSLEAVKESVEKLTTAKVKVRVLHSAVGGITESDVQLAVASRAILVGFGVRAEARVQTEAEIKGIELRFYRIIYELLDDVRKAMQGMLPSLKKEVPLGRVEVRNTFSIGKIGTIAGSYVTQGLIKRSAAVRLLRDSKQIYEGKLSTLRRFKDDVKEVAQGFECGLVIENFNDIKVGDQLEVFEYEDTVQSLD